MLYKENPFAEDTITAGEQLMASMTQERQRKWLDTIESTDMSRNSKKAWNLIRKLNNDPAIPKYQHYPVTANQVAHQLLVNGQTKGKKAPRVKFRKNGKQNMEPNLTSPFTAQEFSNGIAALKNGKAIGLDGIFTEELKTFGQQAKKWLLELFNRCVETNYIPKIWRKSRVIALPKPGKDLSLLKSFRPISLLCHPYKLFERLLLGRLTPVVEPKIIPQQAGFREGKSTTGQLLNLTQHIEDGFEKRLVTGAVFVDLSAAYDTVNHCILMTKIYQMTDDKAMTTLLGTLLKNRMFYVALNQKKSRWRQQRNGLPQGSVLAPLLYNIYTNDQPTDERTSRFIYADDLCITSQESSFEAVERNLTDFLTLLTEYYVKNHLKPNASKTQVCAFHLRNREANRHSELLGPEYRWDATQTLYIWESNSIAHSAIEAIF